MYHSFKSELKVTRIIWTIFIVLQFSFIHSQISFESLVKIDSKDGLPEAQINCSHLDKLGFLWLGTKRGLYRYDGRTFQNHLSDDANIGKNIKCFLQIDSLHFLVGTDYGLVKMNSLNFDFQYLNLENTPNANRKSNHVHEIRKDNYNDYWVVTTGGVFNIKDNLTVHKSYSFDKEEIITASNLQPPRLCIFSNNEVYVIAPISSQNDEYKIYKIGDDKIESIKQPLFPDVKRFLSLLNVNKDECLFLYENTYGKVISGIIETKLQKINYLETPFIKFQNHQPFFSIINDSIIGLDSKGFSDYLIFNKNIKKWFNYKKSENVDYLKSVHFLNDNLFGVTNQELFITSYASKFVQNIIVNPNVHTKQENRYNYLESYGYKITSNNNIITIQDESLKEKTIQLKDKKDLRINQLTELKKYEIILSTNKGTYLLHLQNLIITKLLGEDKPTFFDTLTSRAFKFNDKEIWFGFVQFKGLVKYSIDQKQFHHYPFNEKTENTFFHDVSTITNDNHGNLWLGWIGGGLAKFETNTSTLTVLPQSGYKDVITCITKDDNGAIWFGTNGYGLYRFHPDSMIFTRINKSYDPFISSIICDAGNNIWFTNSTGLVKFNPTTQELFVFTKKHGLSSDKLERLAIDDDRNQLIVSSDLGISLMDNAILNQVNDIKKVYINRIFINGTRVNKSNQNLNLKYNDNNLSIQFSIPDILHGSRDNYFYSINDNENWQNCNSGDINLTGIKSGRHTIRLKICSDNNHCYENEISHFKVALPFWKSFQFYMLITILITSILYSFFKQRINSLKKINELKFKIARDLHDSIGASLSSISFLSRAMVNKNLPFEKQQSIADKISDSSIEAGNNIEEIIWNLQPKDKSVFEVINRAIKQFEEVFENKGMQYNMDLTSNPDKIYLNNLATINLLMVLKEILNNIVKHSKAKNVNFIFSVKNSQLNFEISDNGIGFDSDILRGNGLENIKNRIQDMNGTLYIESDLNIGTKMLITLPY